MSYKGINVSFWCNVGEKLEGGYLILMRLNSPFLLEELPVMVVDAPERLW